MQRTTGRIELEALAQRLKQKEHSVLSILNSLGGLRLVELTSIEIPKYELTSEGEDYGRLEFPERRLVKALEELNGKASLSEASSYARLTEHEQRIAVSWANKNQWIQIRKENNVPMLTLLGTPLPKPYETFLKGLHSGAIKEGDRIRDLEEDILTNRKLITIKTRKLYHANINRNRREEIREILTDFVDEVTHLTPEILTSKTWRDISFKSYNVELEPDYANFGKKHPYADFNDWLREIMIGLGFTEWEGPYVETEFWAHDALFVPQDHVSREVQDQFRIESPYDHADIIDEKYYRRVKAVHENGGDTGSKGWDWPFSREVSTRLCLRPHTTPVSMRYLWEHRESPQKMFIIDRNFRSETLSATHAQEFNQCEGIIMDKSITLRDLLGYLKTICNAVGIEKLKFKPGQFPFTEPSVETFGKHEKLGWIELGGSGIFRPEVTYPLGIKDPVLAWGIGSGRLYMASMGINDIRDLYSRDLNWLRKTTFLREVKP